MEVLPVLPNDAHLMADAPHVISDDEDIDFTGTNIEGAVSNDYPLKKKKYNDVNELHT